MNALAIFSEKSIDMSVDEMNNKLEDLKQELFNLRFQFLCLCDSLSRLTFSFQHNLALMSTLPFLLL